MDENKSRALVPRLPSSFEKAGQGAKRILSAMLADTLACAQGTNQAHRAAVIQPDAKMELEVLCQTGENYYHGRDVPKDDSEAAKWFRVAAERGHYRAQCWLGYFYTVGRGVPQDRKEADRWYREPD